MRKSIGGKKPLWKWGWQAAGGFLFISSSLCFFTSGKEEKIHFPLFWYETACKFISSDVKDSNSFEKDVEKFSLFDGIEKYEIISMSFGIFFLHNIT